MGSGTEEERRQVAFETDGGDCVISWESRFWCALLRYREPPLSPFGGFFASDVWSTASSLGSYWAISIPPPKARAPQMSFSYLQQQQGPFHYNQDTDDPHRPTGGIQFQLPDYLCDYAPPTLAPGGGAEALHPAQAAQWFANSGFSHSAQYPQYAPSSFPAVQDAYESLESLHEAFPGSNINSDNQYPLYAAPAPHWSLSLGLNASPPPHDLSGALPVYSQSGFDTISLLARVQNRARPTIRLGPVDFTTSFVVVDMRRHDDPIVYCSPSFCTLTGYAEREVLGRNCRFLQAPPQGGGPLAKGEARRHTSANAVRALAKAVGGHKEAQVSVVNYRKDGSAFVNLVSVVPLFGEYVDEEGVSDFLYSTATVLSVRYCTDATRSPPPNASGTSASRSISPSRASASSNACARGATTSRPPPLLHPSKKRSTRRKTKTRRRTAGSERGRDGARRSRRRA